MGDNGSLLVIENKRHILLSPLIGEFSNSNSVPAVRDFLYRRSCFGSGFLFNRLNCFKGCFMQGDEKLSQIRLRRIGLRPLAGFVPRFKSFDPPQANLGLKTGPDLILVCLRWIEPESFS
jgi:hypothetical protein